MQSAEERFQQDRKESQDRKEQNRKNVRKYDAQYKPFYLIYFTRVVQEFSI